MDVTQEKTLEIKVNGDDCDTLKSVVKKISENEK